jgi:uncharacterized membrane protein YfcA
MTPLLVLLFGVSPQTAVGTDLLFAAITKITGSAVHGWRDTVEWKIVRRLALGSVPAAVITLAVLAQVGHIGKTMQRDLLLALAVLLALTSLTVLFRNWLIRFAADLDPLDPPGKAIAGTIAAVIGVAVSMTSVGAGAIGVSVLLMLYPRLPIVRIVGSDIAHAAPLALVAGIGHWFIGDVDGVLLTNLLVGSIPGVVVGSSLSTRAPDARVVLAVVLAVSSWQLFLKTTRQEPAKLAVAAVAGPKA